MEDDGAKLYWSASSSGPWQYVGELKAIKATGPDGRTILRSGEPEAIFDLEINESDRRMLAGMKIAQ